MQILVYYAEMIVFVLSIIDQTENRLISNRICQATSNRENGA